MNAVGFGFANIIPLIALLGGAVGLPLGIPPGPEDPLMGHVAPEKCVFYTTWSGIATPDPESTNHTEQLLAEPEVTEMIARIEEAITSGLQKAAGKEGPEAATIADDVGKWVKQLLTRPAAVFVSSVTLGPDGPDIRGGVLVNVGHEAPRLKTALQKYQGKFLRDAVEPVTIGADTWYRIALKEKMPPITWGIKGTYLIVGVGEDAVEGILERARTAPPQWLTELRKELPVDRTATVTYVGLKTIVDKFAPMGGPQVKTTLDAIGLGNVASLATVTGLDEQGFVNRVLLQLDGEPQGLLKTVTDGRLSAADLAVVPGDATLAVAAKLDANTVLEAFIALVGAVEPRAHEELLEGLADLDEDLDFSLRNDLLQPLGDTWRLYNSPSEGGLVITGLTAVVGVDDHQRLAATQAKLIAVARTEFGDDDEGEEDRRRGPRIEQFEFAGQTVYLLNARDKEFPLAPSWCLTDKELIVAPFPQNVKAYLSRDANFESLAASDQVAPLLQPGEGPLLLTYYDTRKLFELIYPFVPAVAQVALGEMAKEGVDLNVSILPSAAAIGKHLQPGVAVVRRTPAGIEIIGRQTLPGGNIGATAPLAVGLLLPAVQSARGAARRVQSANNLKQIAMAMHMHEADHGSFPAAYIADADGKPLLSWRVAILPYIDQRGLYEQFKLDEPWDSPSNKPLIPRMSPIFKPPASRAPPGMTNYLTVRGEGTVFPGKDAVKMAEITDGASNTIMAVEVGDEEVVVWTRPIDFEYDEDDPAAGLSGLQPEGFNAAFCDGSVRLIAEETDPVMLKRMFTRNDGEPIK